jgi:uncharacterized membrane protein
VITKDDKFWAAIAYLFPVLGPVLIFLMEEKRSRIFIREHNAQALISGIILSLIFPLLIIATLGIGSLAYLVMVYWAYKAYKGESIDIPWVTNWVQKKGWA